MEILGGTMQVCSLMPRAMLRCGVRRSRPADPPRLSCVGAGPRIAAVSPSAQKRIAGVGPVIDLWCRCDGPAAGPLRRESGGARAMDLFALRAYPPLPHGNGRGVPQRGMVDTVPFVDMAKLVRRRRVVPLPRVFLSVMRPHCSVRTRVPGGQICALFWAWWTARQQDGKQSRPALARRSYSASPRGQRAALAPAGAERRRGKEDVYANTQGGSLV